MHFSKFVKRFFAVLSLAAKFAALMRFNICFLQQFHVFRRRQGFPWNAAFGNYFVCFPEFSRANCTLALARHCSSCLLAGFRLVFVGRRQSVGLEVEMGNDLSVQEAWAGRVPIVLKALGGHYGAETLQETNVVLVNLVRSLTLLLHLLQLGRDVRIVVGWVEINCWTSALHLLAMLVKAF